jgi:pimeloyl-ACP methyl ester carboxylesterase
MPVPPSALWTQTFGHGPLILWLHGLGESSLCFAAIARHPLLAGYRHRLLDLPGYGRSPWPTDPYRLDDLADELADWLSEAGEPVIAIGHSMGGVLAQLLAERIPLRAVVNIDGNLSLGDCSFSGRAAAMDEDYFARAGFDELRDLVYGLGAQSAALRGYYASLRFADPRVFHRHSRDLIITSQGEDFAARAAALPMPALYIAGVPDGACEHSKALLAASGATWMGIEPAGHWPFLDQPDAFAAAVASFLGSLGQRRRRRTSGGYGGGSADV